MPSKRKATGRDTEEPHNAHRVDESNLDEEISELLLTYPLFTTQEAASVREGIWMAYHASSSASIVWDFSKDKEDTICEIINHGKALLASIEKWPYKYRLNMDVGIQVQHAISVAEMILKMPLRPASKRGRMARSDIKSAVYLLATYWPKSMGVTVSKQTANAEKKSMFHQFCEKVFQIIGLPSAIPASTLNDYIAEWRTPYDDPELTDRVRRMCADAGFDRSSGDTTGDK